MFIAGLVDIVNVKIYFFDGFLGRHIINSFGDDAGMGNNGHFIVIQIKYIAGIRNQRRYIRSDKKLIFTHSDNNGTSLAGDVHFFGIVLSNDNQSKGAFHLQ